MKRALTILVLACSALVVTNGCGRARRELEIAYFPKPPAKAHVVHLASFNSLDVIAPRRPTFVEIVRGEAIRPFAQAPMGMAYHSGKLYVCDSAARIVHVWDLNTGVTSRLGSDLSAPVGVAVAQDGAVFVADSERGEVVEFDAEGAVRRRYRADRDSYRPIAVAVAGGSVYVADAVLGRVDAFSRTDGSFEESLVPTVDDEELHALPTGLAMDSNGRLYVSDMVGGRLLVFGTDRKLERVISQRGNRYGDLGQPKGIAIGPDGVVFIADAEFAHVHLFNQEGQLLMLLGGAEGAGKTPMPIGVTTAADIPDSIRAMIPDNFNPRYLLFVSNTVGDRRINLYAVGLSR